MKKIFFYALGLMCALSAQASVTTYAYDGDKSEAENGTALQAAIDAAAESGIDTLKVQAGTYYGNFTMKQGVNVIGGWNATFENQTDYATILDAQADGRVVNQAAAFEVLTVWSNLTIQNGNVTGAGGGVQLFKNGKLLHCTVTNNTATTQGGGIYCDDSNAGVIVDSCIVSNNTANQGGGMRIRGTVQNTTVENNTITDAGGGIHLQGATAINCLVRNNKSKAGGGIRAYGGTVRNCIIEGNSTTTSNTGGVYLQVGAQMYNSIIRNNTSGENTGGVRMTYDSNKSCTLANCLIVGNSATQTIGGLSLEGGVHNVYNNTIIDNKQTLSSNPTRCGVRLNVGASLLFCNNIVWGNSAADAVQNSQMEINTNYISGKAEFFRNNAIVYTSEFGTNTVLLSADTDPGFVDASEGDFRLLWTSALVNAGNNSDAQGTTDLDGIARVAGGTVDLGCYELPHFTLTIAAFEHATLTVGGEEKTAGDYALPQGYTATATIEAEEGYHLTGVTLDGVALEPVEEVYTLPAITADATLALSIEEDEATGIDQITNAQRQSQKLLKDGQLFILRDGKEFNVLGAQL